MMPTVVAVIFGGLWTLTVAMAIGQSVLRLLRVKLTREEECFLGFLVGAVGLSMLVFALACLRMVYWQVFLAVGAVIVAVRFRFPEPQRVAVAMGGISRRLTWLYWLLGGTFGLLYLIVALAPEISADGVVYHVGWISRYYQHHGFFRVTTNMYANLSAGAEMLYLFAYAFGRHSACALVHLFFLIALALGICTAAIRMGIPSAGPIAALIMFMSPVVGKDATSAYNDVAAAAFVFGTFFVLQLWLDCRESKLLGLAGLLAGACYATKYTMGIAVVYAVAFVAIAEIFRRGRVLLSAFIVIISALVVMAPWMIKNYMWMQNPFFPFFNHWFPNPYFYELVEVAYKDLLSKFNGVRLLDIPLEVTLGGSRLLGIVGPVFLLSPLVLLSVRSPASRQALLAFVVFLAPYFFNIGTRFLIPSLPFLALSMAVLLARQPSIAGVVLLAHGILSWPSTLNVYAPHAWRIEQSHWKAALRIQSETDFFNEFFSEYRAGLMLNQYVPKGDRVYSPSLNQIAYHDRDLVGTYASSLSTRTFNTFISPVITDNQAEWLREYFFGPTLLERIRLIQLSETELEWSIHELLLYSEGREIGRQPSWLLRASANPWEVERAFDGSRASWWRSGRHVTSGMSVELDFGATTMVDRVSLHQSVSQGNLPAKIQGYRDGQWVDLKATERWSHYGPAKHLRRAVMDDFKDSGIKWLLLRDEDYAARDLLERWYLWGVTFVAEIDGYRLWRID